MKNMTYAINYVLDEELLKSFNLPSEEKPHEQIKQILMSFGFVSLGGGLFICNNSSAVKCVLAVQELNKKLKWFKRCVFNNINMFRIDEMCDLTIAI